MIAPSVSLFILLAAPTWKVVIDHREDLKGTANMGGKTNQIGGSSVVSEVFIGTVTSDADSRPTSMDLTMVTGILGDLSVGQERGETVVRYKKPPLQDQMRLGVAHYFEHLVQQDDERAAMSKCDAASTEATTRWLQKNVQTLTLGSTAEVVMRKVVIRCTKVKGAVVHEVSFGATVPRNRSMVELQLKGKVRVDPAIWVTTWRFSGPMSVVAGSTLLSMNMSGTFASELNVSKK